MTQRPKNVRANTAGLVKPELIAVDITPGLAAVQEAVQASIWWPNCADKYAFHLPYHILNYSNIVQFGIQSQMDAAYEEKEMDEFLFRLHESIYMENIRALGDAVGQMSGFIVQPKAAAEYHSQVCAMQEAYNNALVRTDKWDEWRASQQSWVQAFSIIACAHACLMTSMFRVDARPTQAERLFPLAVQDVRNTGFPVDVLV